MIYWWTLLISPYGDVLSFTVELTVLWRSEFQSEALPTGENFLGLGMVKPIRNSAEKKTSGKLTYGKWPIIKFIVDLPIKNGGSFHIITVSLPEAHRCCVDLHHRIIPKLKNGWWNVLRLTWNQLEIHLYNYRIQWEFCSECNVKTASDLGWAWHLWWFTCLVKKETIAQFFQWVNMFKVPYLTNWWFQPPWKILVRLDHHPNYWGKYKMFQSPPTS